MKHHVVNIIHILFLGLFLFLLVNGKTMLWLALFAVSLVAALIFGRVYCGYVCPMNTLMILVERLSKKLKYQAEGAPKWLKNGYFAWIMLIVSILTLLLSKQILHINLPILPFWLAIAVLLTLRYKPSVFHNLICPFGTLQRTFGKFPWLSQKVNKDSCIGCKLCEKACSSDAITVSVQDKKAMIYTELCHQCINCQQVCPKEAIFYCK